MTKGKLKAAFIVSLAFNVAVIGALAFAYARGLRGYNARPGAGPPFSPSERIMMMRCRRLGRELGLDAEQLKLFESRFASFQKEDAGLRDELRRSRDKLFELISSPEPDEGAILEKVREISAIQGRLEGLFVKRLLRMREVLRPEQRKALMEMLRCRMGPHRSGCPRGDRLWHESTRRGGRAL